MALRPREAILAASLGVAVAIPLGACSSPATAPVPSPAAVAAAPVITVPAPANPVPVLRRTGAAPDPGEILGLTDLEGDRYATGSYPGGEQVSVYTFATAAAQTADLARNSIPADGHAVIRAHLTDIYVTATDSAEGYTYTVTPAQVAARTGGKVISP